MKLSMMSYPFEQQAGFKPEEMFKMVVEPGIADRRFSRRIRLDQALLLIMHMAMSSGTALLRSAARVFLESPLPDFRASVRLALTNLRSVLRRPGECSGSR